MLRTDYDKILSEEFLRITGPEISKMLDKTNTGIIDWKATLEDLIGQARLRCLTKIQYALLITRNDVKNAIRTQAHDVVAEFYSGREKRKKIINDLKKLCERPHKRYEDNNSITNILGLVEDSLVDYDDPCEKRMDLQLFEFRVFDNIPYKKLAPFFNMSCTALRQRYSRMIGALRKVLTREKILQMK